MLERCFYVWTQVLFPWVVIAWYLLHIRNIRWIERWTEEGIERWTAEEIKRRPPPPPATFEEYRRDLWRMAEGAISIDEFLAIYRFRKAPPRPKPEPSKVERARSVLAKIRERIEKSLPAPAVPVPWAPKFRVGQWVRFEDKDATYGGRLARVVGLSDDGKAPHWYSLVVIAPHEKASTTAFEAWIELAVPRVGEHWQWTPCHHNPWVKWPEPFLCQNSEGWDHGPEYSACGCLSPVGFGKDQP